MWNREDLEEFVGLDYDPGSGAIEGPLGDVARIYCSRNRSEQCGALGALLAASPRLALACQSAMALAGLIEKAFGPRTNEATISVDDILEAVWALGLEARAALAAAGVSPGPGEAAQPVEEPEGPAGRAERRADRHERLGAGQGGRAGRVEGVDQ